MYGLKNSFQKISEEIQIPFKISEKDGSVIANFLQGNNSKIVSSILRMPAEELLLETYENYSNCISLLKYCLEQELSNAVKSKEEIITDIIKGKEFSNDILKEVIKDKPFKLILIYLKDKHSKAIKLIEKKYLQDESIIVIQDEYILIISKNDISNESIKELLLGMKKNIAEKCYISYCKIDEYNELKEKFSELNLQNQLTLDEIPEIDLYMDQVTQLFDSKFNETKRNEDDKALTKTMVNNYAKGKLLMSVKNKKYSKEHLLLMSLIYNLKGALSISDIKSSLNKIVISLENEEDYPIRELYKLYLKQYGEDLKDVEGSIKIKYDSIENMIAKEENLSSDEFEKNFLLLSSFINMSNMYRRMGEKLIDDYFNKL